MSQFKWSAMMGGLLLAPLSFGAGFQLNEFSVAAMGRAQAGEAAMSDTAAAIARNPAVMGNMDKAMVSVAFHYIDPNVDVEGTAASTRTATLTTNADAKDVAPSAFIPGLYYANPINEQWAVGLALNSHFGLSTDYGNDYAATVFAEETLIHTYYVTPSVSFKPVESVSLGLGVSYIHGKGEIKNSTTKEMATLTANQLPNNTTLLSLEGDGDAWGYQLGVAWNVVEGHTLGVRYESAVDLDFEGDITYLPSPNAKSGTLTANLPAIFEVGYVGKLTDRWSVMAGAQQTRWHSFKTLTADIDGEGKQELKDEQWQDAWRYSVGGEYAMSEDITLRAGIGYDNSPVREKKRTLSIPDADREWYSIGASFKLAKAGSIDASFMYLTGGEADVNETKAFPPAAMSTSFSGKLSAVDVFLYGIQYNYSF